MQAGDSYYIPPPPLPVNIDNHSHNQQHGHWPDTIPPLQPLGQPLPASIPLTGSPPPGPPPALLPPSSRPAPKSKLGKRGADTAEPSTLSGFKNLKSLSVLDIDNLDIVSELKTCVKGSFSTLKDLQLSLSDPLAQQARRPPADSDADDSDVEDEFQVVPTSDNATNYDATGPAKVFRAQEERKLQELILNKIFDIEEPHLVKKSPMHLSTSLNLQPKSDVKSGGSKSSPGDPREDFVTSIRTASTRLMALMNGSKDFSISQQEVLDIIEKAARKYVESDSTSNMPSDDAVNAKGDSEGSKPQTTPTSSETPRTAGHIETNQEGATSNDMDTTGETSALQQPADKASREDCKSTRVSQGGEESSPDDIDIEHLETLEEHIDEFDDLQPGETSTSGKGFTPRAGPSSQGVESNRNQSSAPKQNSQPAKGDQDDNKPDSKPGKADHEAILEKLVQLHRLVFDVGQRVLEIRDERANESSSTVASALDSELALLNRSAIEVSNEIRILESEIEDLLEAPNARKGENLKQNMVTYARQTRGMSIETLKLCLIPVKASVLSQAIDVACIKELTLLNVGNQAPIWSMLTKEQKVRPIALRSVFTDHVSASFLTCMAQLPQLDDLFMLERSMKHKPESFAPRTATSIDQIRRLVLKKHMPTLKRLMIKDESNGPNWDANEKTMILICTRGIKLEELALSMNIHAVVSVAER